MRSIPWIHKGFRQLGGPPHRGTWTVVPNPTSTTLRIAASPPSCAPCSASPPQCRRHDAGSGGLTALGAWFCGGRPGCSYRRAMCRSCDLLSVTDPIESGYFGDESSTIGVWGVVGRTLRSFAPHHRPANPAPFAWGVGFDAIKAVKRAAACTAPHGDSFRPSSSTRQERRASRSHCGSGRKCRRSQALGGASFSNHGAIP